MPPGFRHQGRLRSWPLSFGAENAFFMVNGTTSAVQSMVLAACKKGEKIILPRNVHRSVINALVLSGAEPVYVNPEMNHKLGIALGMSVAQVEKAILENPSAKAVLVNNPTYYGVCSNLRAITELAHRHNMLVLADEAHGTHFYFGENMPPAAMRAGADMASVSMHKSGGSLTQSSLLLTGKKRQSRLCEPDHQPDPDHQRLLPAAFQPGYLPAEPGAEWKRDL